MYQPAALQIKKVCSYVCPKKIVMISMLLSWHVRHSPSEPCRGDNCSQLPSLPYPTGPNGAQSCERCRVGPNLLCGLSPRCGVLMGYKLQPGALKALNTSGLIDGKTQALPLSVVFRCGWKFFWRRSPSGFDLHRSGLRVKCHGLDGWLKGCIHRFCAFDLAGGHQGPEQHGTVSAQAARPGS